MTLALAALALAAPVQLYKYVTIDDFTAGPWTTTLVQHQQVQHIWNNLDKRHCLFGNRTVFLEINSNPNQTSLTYSLGNHEQKLSSPLPIGWRNTLIFGNDWPADVDLTHVDRFLLDTYALGGSAIPDTMVLTVHDTAFHYGIVGWNIRPGGVYFDKGNFPQGIDWKHIAYLELQQDFQSLPNPSTYSATCFYARVKPGLEGPGIKVPPLSLESPD